MSKETNHIWSEIDSGNEIPRRTQPVLFIVYSNGQYFNSSRKFLNFVKIVPSNLNKYLKIQLQKRQKETVVSLKYLDAVLSWYFTSKNSEFLIGESKSHKKYPKIILFEHWLNLFCLIQKKQKTIFYECLSRENFEMIFDRSHSSKRGVNWFLFQKAKCSAFKKFQFTQTGSILFDSRIKWIQDTKISNLKIFKFFHLLLEGPLF